MRICSLLPSTTELCCALGLADDLVAVTHECDFPAEMGLKPRVTKSGISSRLQGAEIDRRVRMELAEGSGSLYELDIELLERLAPDLILTQALCTVCAVSHENVLRAAHHLSSKPRVLNVEPRSVDGIFESFLDVGRAAGVPERAAALVAASRSRLERLRKLTAGVKRKKVVCLEWLDPPFCAGHWIPELVELAGGTDELGRKHAPSAQVAWNQIIEYNPETIIVMCCGFSAERSLEEWGSIEEHNAGRYLENRTPHVAVVDGSAYFSRPGPRIVESAEILAFIMHPGLFPGGYPPEVLRTVVQ